MANEDEPGDEAPAKSPSEKYNQDFFLALCREGKDAWNAWRREPANKNVRVTFARIDFSEAPKDGIDFSGFEFGDYANFSGCRWRGIERKDIQENFQAFKPGRARFAGSVFGLEAKFTGAAFGSCATFAGVTFGRYATFAGAVFGSWASFTCADFGYGADFSRASFGDEASFTIATFGNVANFACASFGNSADFTGAAFDLEATFTGVMFGTVATFEGAAFRLMADFSRTHFKGPISFAGMSARDQWTRVISRAAHGVGEEARAALEKRHKESSKRDRFVKLLFANASFYDEAIFRGRSFEQIADFTGARFCHPPDFDGATNLARIDFTGVHIGFITPGRFLHFTSDTEVPIRLRALRKIAEETKNHDLERDLYIEERKAERGVYLHQLLGLDELKKNLEDINKQKKHVWLEWRLQRRARNAHWIGILAKPDKIARLFTHVLWIAVMAAYWALADYGRSFVRPLAALIASVFFFDWRYAEVLGPLMAKAPDVDKYKQTVGMLALGNAVPFVGPLTIDAKIKEFLFCPDNAASCLPPIPPEGFQFLVIAQNALSIALIFFIGLALRNYFKIK